MTDTATVRRLADEDPHRRDLIVAALHGCADEIERLREELVDVERRGRVEGLREAAELVEGSAYVSSAGRTFLEPVNPSLRGMDVHHSTIAASLRALADATEKERPE